MLTALKTGSAPQPTLSISGPFGDCTWHQPPSTAGVTIMLANGTGIAPLAALVDEALATSSAGPIVLYWGGRHASDFYCTQRFAALALVHPQFRFIPVIDAAHPDWCGRLGFVQDCTAADFPDLALAQVYACGSPLMVRSARDTLTRQCGLDPAHFYADAFEASGSTQLANDLQALIQVQLRLANGQEQQLQLPTGNSLLAALRSQGWLQGICGGQKACGSCRIELQAPADHSLPAPDRVEARLLAALPEPRPADRLACQIHLTPEFNGLRCTLSDRPL